MPKASTSSGSRRSRTGVTGKKSTAVKKSSGSAAGRGKASTAKKSTSPAKKRSATSAGKRAPTTSSKRRAAAPVKKGTALKKGAGTAKKRSSATTAGRKAVARKGSPAGKTGGAKKAAKATAAKRTPAAKAAKPAARKSTKKSAAKSTVKRTAKVPVKKKPAAKKTTKRAAPKPKTRPAGKSGAPKKTAKALGRPKKKITAAGASSLQKVLAAHGVERKAPAVRPPFPAYRGTMPYIFVSYSHADMKEVFQVIKQLNASRYRIWFDEGIEPGNEWPEVVGRAVLGCSQFIVFMSPTAVESRNVRNEINLATSAGKNIIVIYLSSTALTEGLLLQIGTVQYYNKFEMVDREFMDKLKRVLSNDLHN
jgi:hypothetical protein